VTASAGLVVLSPHLDDAVLSVGALIAREAAGGRVVEVWTAFTSGPDPQTLSPRLRRFADYGTRLAEDSAALDLLGAGCRRLGLSERLWRSPAPGGPLAGLLGSDLRAAFRTPPGRDGFQELGTLTDLVEGALADDRLELLAPLGIGNHADHVEVMLAVALAAVRAKALDRVGFYEDFYALGNAARRRHPVSRRRPSALWRSPGWAAPVEGAVLRLTPLIARGPSVLTYLPGLAELGWRCEAHPVGAAEEERKLAAVEQYRSQTPALGGMHRLGRILRRAHRVRGGELIWRARPR
jgi:LmbE family N-acetylglucosaminyl deacetylase